MDLLAFSHDILKHIFTFLDIKEYFSVSIFCKRLNKYLSKIFFLDLSVSKKIIDLPNNLVILKVYDYDYLSKLKLPNSIRKIILEFLDFLIEPDYKLLDVEILSIKYLNYMEGDEIERNLNFKSFKNLKSLYIRKIENLEFFTFPDSLKNIYCWLLFY